MANPKIVYTLEDGTDQTLNFAFPPRQQPAYVKTAVRHDNISTAGVRESVLERVDEFLEFTMDSIRTGADLEAWQAFLDYALGGAPFAFYADSSQAAFINYALEDTETRIEYKSPGVYSLTLKFRRYVP
jgi:hypothetical protein